METTHSGLVAVAKWTIWWPRIALPTADRREQTRVFLMIALYRVQQSLAARSTCHIFLLHQCTGFSIYQQNSIYSEQHDLRRVGMKPCRVIRISFSVRHSRGWNSIRTGEQSRCWAHLKKSRDNVWRKKIKQNKERQQNIYNFPLLSFCICTNYQLNIYNFPLLPFCICTYYQF